MSRAPHPDATREQIMDALAAYRPMWVCGFAVLLFVFRQGTSIDTAFAWSNKMIDRVEKELLP